jgi:hypothetical protein
VSKKNLLLSIFLVCIFYSGNAQNTIGLISYNADKTFEGYNLIFPHNQEKVFLLNNCGQIVHSWEDDAMYRPGNTVYLQENGNLVKCKRPNVSVNDPIWAGGGGAVVEILDWDNNLLWSFEQNDSLRRLHHDIEPMPNGNILMISWEYKSYEEAVQAGRDTALLFDGHVWPDYILEVNPETDEIVWEWHVWDHLIQDYDLSKDNYGVVADHPELVDVNWIHNGEGKQDWMHSNAIDYNSELDQIVISVPYFNEIWIIDHSTTTAEAAGHTGGLGGRGGDLLYRWGNPLTYGAGTADDQKLFFQHDIHWVGDFVDSSHPHYGKLAVFNNRVTAEYSTVNIFDPGFGWDSWSYPFLDDVWGPTDFDVTIMHPQPTSMYSTGVSSVQLLPNGNTLICSGRMGYAFELTAENEIVWEYITPLMGGNPVAQGDTIDSGNLTFRLNRYPADFPGFDGRDLEPKGYIELNPDSTFCDMLIPVEDLADKAFKIFPNPAFDIISFEQQTAEFSLIEIFDVTGKVKQSYNFTGIIKQVDISTWLPGIYFARVNGVHVYKFIITR